MVEKVPFSLVVNDASVNFHELVGKLVGSLDKTDGVLNGMGDGRNNSWRYILSTPSVVMITLKLPHIL